MPRRSPRWFWIGGVVFVLVTAALVMYLVSVGLDKADKVASGISAVLALLALGLPCLLPTAAGAPSAGIHVSRTGKVTVGRGAHANTGLRAPAAGLTGDIVVERTGDIQASGGGRANTGVELT